MEEISSDDDEDETISYFKNKTLHLYRIIAIKRGNAKRIRKGGLTEKKKYE